MKTVKLIFVKIHFKNVRFIFHTALQKNLKIFFGNLKKTKLYRLSTFLKNYLEIYILLPKVYQNKPAIFH